MTESSYVLVFSFGNKELYTLTPVESKILTESSGFLSPQSEHFHHWANHNTVDLVEFNPNDLKLLVAVLCNQAYFITLPSLLPIFQLCSYLLIDETLLIQKTKSAPYQDMKPFDNDVRKLFDLIYDCKKLGYEQLGEHIAKLNHVPLPILREAKNKSKFKKRMRSARKHYYWYLTRIIPTCICMKCAEFRSIRFMHGWHDEEEEVPNYPYPLGVGPYITIFPHEC